MEACGGGVVVCGGVWREKGVVWRGVYSCVCYVCMSVICVVCVRCVNIVNGFGSIS